MEDDPREVLALLNSLGFVGISASQLKAFMKELKLYRKMKERERQQRKEDITRKIIQKQQTMVQEILRERTCEIQSSTVSSESTLEEPWLKLRVTYETEEESDKDSKSTKENDVSSRTGTSRKFNVQSATVCRNIKPCIKSDRDKLEKENINNKIKSVKDKKEPNNDQYRTVNTNKHLLEPLNIQTGSARSQIPASTKSSAQTGSKSFIRPWRLHPEVQSAPRNVKRLDPVTLYQKYQKEWKQMSLPGEAKHTAIRWAIREKMLGTDPHPLPLTAKYKISTSRKK